MEQNPAIKTLRISKFFNNTQSESLDHLAVEEPLEISILLNNSVTKVSITMRTPGNDKDLAIGFLFTEGIISSSNEIINATHTQTLPGIESNTLLVELAENTQFDTSKLNRNFYTTSSCGVCGKASIDAIQTVSPFQAQKKNIAVHADLLCQLPNKLRNVQETFEKTGGLHAAALFDLTGNLLLMREDVGRHNALDKLIGSMLLKNLLPLEEHVLILSGRGSFELIQKAAMAGIQIIGAVGAPSSLAVETAERFGITLVGFLKADKFNIYSNPKSILFN